VHSTPTPNAPTPSAPTPSAPTPSAPTPSPTEPPRRRARSVPDYVDPSEARGVLLHLAADHTGAIPGTLLVDHVLDVTRGGEWPVQRAALEAVLRRFAFAERDALIVADRPARGAAVGRYHTSMRVAGRRRRVERPYTTVLESLVPLRVRCGCPDYVRSSLGLCKHGLAVLGWIAARPRLVERAFTEADGPRAARLTWDPVRPLTGVGDPLERVHLEGALPKALSKRTWARHLRPDARGDRLVVAATHADDPRRRLALITALLEADLTLTKLSRTDADPGLRAMLTDERADVERRVACAALGDALPKRCEALKRQPYPYQLEGVRRFLTSGRLLLADDMGLGKTVQAIAACDVVWHAGRVKRGVIITPASLKSQWVREWRATSDAPITVLDGDPETRRAQLEALDAGFLVANYEQVVRDLALFERIGLDLVVLDEAQRIKNWSTKTAQAIKRLRAPYRLVLTGTPLENRLEELASLLDVVDDRALEPKWRLVPLHQTLRGNAARGGARGLAHLDTLRARIAPVMVRRLRTEVLGQLPERTDTRVPVELTPAQMAEHDALNPSIASLIARTKTRALRPEEFQRLMQLLTAQRMISNGLALYQFDSVWPTLRESTQETALVGRDSPKLVELRRLIRALAVDQGRKVIVFSQWRRMLKLAAWAVEDVLREAGLRALFFTGAESQALRTQAVVELHDDPSARVMFLTDAGGVGLNLQRAATACINLELPWNPAVLEQRIGRIHRLGQAHKIDVYDLVAETGIEARITEIVGEKRRLFNELFDGSNDEVRFTEEPSFFARLEAVLSPLAVAAPSEPAAEGGDAEPTADDDDREGEVDASFVEAQPTTEDAELVAPPAVLTRALADVVDDSAPAPEAPRSEPQPTASSVQRMFETLEVRRTDDGGLTLHAPKESADTLASLFEGMAALLRRAT
jgi:superfamily II DNA or RNA helicase